MTLPTPRLETPLAGIETVGFGCCCENEGINEEEEPGTIATVTFCKVWPDWPIGVAILFPTELTVIIEFGTTAA